MKRVKLLADHEAYTVLVKCTRSTCTKSRNSFITHRTFEFERIPGKIVAGENGVRGSPIGAREREARIYRPTNRPNVQTNERTNEQMEIKKEEEEEKKKISHEYNSTGLKENWEVGSRVGRGCGAEIISSFDATSTGTNGRREEGWQSPLAELDKFSIRSLIGRLFHPPRKRIQWRRTWSPRHPLLANPPTSSTSSTHRLFLFPFSTPFSPLPPPLARYSRSYPPAINV